MFRSPSTTGISSVQNEISSVTLKGRRQGIAPETSRRNLLLHSASISTVAMVFASSTESAVANEQRPSPYNAPLVTRERRNYSDWVVTNDGTKIFYKDWGTGPPIVFSHGWPLQADVWDAQMLFLGNHGFRVIAHDRRSHGRSTQTWNGNDLDTYADDLSTLIEALDLSHIILIGHRPVPARSRAILADTEPRESQKLCC